MNYWENPKGIFRREKKKEQFMEGGLKNQL